MVATGTGACPSCRACIELQCILPYIKSCNASTITSWTGDVVMILNAMGRCPRYIRVHCWKAGVGIELEQSALDTAWHALTLMPEDHAALCYNAAYMYRIMRLARTCSVVLILGQNSIYDCTVQDLVKCIATMLCR